MSEDLKAAPDAANENTPESGEVSNAEPSNVTSQDDNLAPLKGAEHNDYTGKPKEVQVDFTYPTHTDPMRAKDPHGIYLDDVQRENAEIQRAKVEGREPDLENPPSIQGTPLQASHIVQSNLPGDFVIKPDVTLPVVVGVLETDEVADRPNVVPVYQVTKDEYEKSHGLNQKSEDKAKV